VTKRRASLIQTLLLEIRSAKAALDEVDDVFADYIGVNRTDARCLEILDREGPMAAGDIARTVGLTTGAVTAVLDRLEAVGYARRRHDADDRRRILIEITPRFRSLGADAYAADEEALRELLDDYNDRELDRLIDFHARIRDLGASRLEQLRTLRDGRRRRVRR
jgi:DNA-binding MarR family transcriptional regulator